MRVLRRTRRHAASIPPRKGSGAAKRIPPDIDTRPTTVAAWDEERRRLRERVAETFEAKAAAIGFPEHRLKSLIDRLLLLPVAAGKPHLTPGETPDFLSFVADGCVKTVADVHGSLVTVQFAKPAPAPTATPTAAAAPSGAPQVGGAEKVEFK